MHLPPLYAIVDPLDPGRDPAALAPARLGAGPRAVRFPWPGAGAACAGRGRRRGRHDRRAGARARPRGRGTRRARPSRAPGGSMTTGHVNGTVIDADGHVLEPRGMWERYLDPKLAEQILVPDPATGTRVLPAEHNPQAMRPHPISGTVGRLLGLAGSVGRRADDVLTGKIGYEDGPAGAFDGRARLTDIDTEGIDVAVLYPTILLSIGNAPPYS